MPGCNLEESRELQSVHRKKTRHRKTFLDSQQVSYIRMIINIVQVTETLTVLHTS